MYIFRTRPTFRAHKPSQASKPTRKKTTSESVTGTQDGNHIHFSDIAKDAVDYVSRSREQAAENIPQGEHDALKKEGVLILASELASCIGVNKYRPQHVAIEEMWRRQFPLHFQHVCDLLKKKNLPVHVSRQETGKKPLKRRRPRDSESNSEQLQVVAYYVSCTCVYA
jgi:hypothetical protein